MNEWQTLLHFNFLVFSNDFVQHEYDEIAAELDEGQSVPIGNLFRAVLNVFEPMAHWEWLEWGGYLLFCTLKAVVKEEEKEKEDKI